MKRMLRRILIVFAAVIVLTATAGATYQWRADRRDLAATPPPGRLVDIGGHRLHVWCKGAGSPAVVMDAGLGGTAFGWNFVQDGVAEFTQACAYDRAGQGYSDEASTPRTSLQIARDLGELLSRAGIVDPVIMVGSSFGGFNARLFASEYPARTAGLVLVDASHENQGGGLPWVAPLIPLAGSLGVLRLFGVSLGPNPESEPAAVREFQRATSFRTSRFRSMHDEGIHLDESAAQVRASRRELSIPLVVITRGHNSTPEWTAFQQDQVKLSKRGCQIIAEESGHLVPRDRPEVVVDAIRKTIEASKSPDAIPCDL